MLVPQKVLSFIQEIMIFGKSVIKEEGYSNKVLIDKKQDCLIDGKDTIRNFEVFLKDQLIMVYPKEDDRIYVYKFK